MTDQQQVTSSAATLPVAEVTFDKTVYPRIQVIASLVQQYAQDLDFLPPVEVDQNHRLIDGVHRWMAHQKANRETIDVIITEVRNDHHFLELAVDRNASHGQQLSQEDKKQMALQMYSRVPVAERKEFKVKLQRLFCTHKNTINNWVSKIDSVENMKRDRVIREMWYGCYDDQTIAEEVGMERSAITKKTKDFVNLNKDVLIHKPAALYQDEDFKPPLYNLWNDLKLTNNVGHFGNTEQAFVDRLLYLYTKPFDIVIDPFAGGGSTIDVCRQRSRRFLVSDRKPIIERADEIRQHDVTNGPLKPPQWKDVSLVYLDPPYWRQAAGQYSDDPTDLGNMSLEDFNKTLSSLILHYAKCLGRSQRDHPSYIALIIRPTQWNADNKAYTDHVTDMVTQVGLPVDMRISAPYSSEQYNAQCVNWAKENRKLLVLTRDIVVWRIEK